MRKKQGLKIFSLVICLLFIWQQTVMCAPNVYKIKVSEEYGRVLQRYKGKGEKVVVHIQDAHNNSDAQENLARLICELIPQIRETVDHRPQTAAPGRTSHRQSPGNVPFIGVEGAVGAYDLGDVADFPVPEAREIVGRDLIREGKLIGAEYARLISENDFTLLGLEEEGLFKQDLAAFNAVHTESGGLMEQVHELEEALGQLKEITFNKELRQFDAKAILYEENPEVILDNLDTVYRGIDAAGIDILDYVNLLQFKEVFHIGKTIDEDLLRKEITHLSRRVTGAAARADKAGLRRFAKQYTAYQQKAVTRRTFLNRLASRAAAAGISLSEYPHISRRISYWRKYALIDMGALMREVEDVSQDIRLALSQTDQERRLIDISARLRSVRRLITLTAVKHEVERFNQSRQAHSLSAIRRDIAAIAGTAPRLKEEIDVPIETIEEFYRLAAQRDKVMLGQLLAGMEKTGQHTGVLVAGGYHSDGLVDLLKKEHISYVTITPHIDTVKEDVPYIKRLTGKIAPFTSPVPNARLISQINASVRAINPAGFETILREAGLRMSGQTVLTEKGEVLSPERIKAVAARIRANPDADAAEDLVLAEVLESVAETIDTVAARAVSPEMSDAENARNVIDSLRPILQERVGAFITEKSLEREAALRTMDQFISDMNESFMELVQAPGSRRSEVGEARSEVRDQESEAAGDEEQAAQDQGGVISYAEMTTILEASEDERAERATELLEQTNEKNQTRLENLQKKLQGCDQKLVISAILE